MNLSTPFIRRPVGRESPQPHRKSSVPPDPAPPCTLRGRALRASSGGLLLEQGVDRRSFNRCTTRPTAIRLDSSVCCRRRKSALFWRQMGKAPDGRDAIGRYSRVYIPVIFGYCGDRLGGASSGSTYQSRRLGAGLALAFCGKMSVGITAMAVTPRNRIGAART
jgi:hypothetical protein